MAGSFPPAVRGSPPWITKSCTVRWKICPSKKCWFVRNTRLFTVFGASLGSSSTLIVPQDVTMVMTYFLLVSMVIFGGFLYCFFFTALAFGTFPPQATTAAEGVAVGLTAGVAVG